MLGPHQPHTQHLDQPRRHQLHRHRLSRHHARRHPQLFATDTTGAVRTQRQTATGFPGTWTTIPGITAAGSPSAIKAPDGRLQIVIRSTDNYAYYTSETTAGTTTFTPWQTITTSETTTTDPTALTVPSNNTWVVAYINDTNTPRLRRGEPTHQHHIRQHPRAPRGILTPATYSPQVAEHRDRLGRGRIIQQHRPDGSLTVGSR